LPDFMKNTLKEV